MGKGSKKAEGKKGADKGSGKAGKREPYVSRFKKAASGFGSGNFEDSGKSGYRGPSGPVGIQRPRGANRGS